MVGRDSIISKLHDGADYFTSLTAKSYQWSYGCGGGSYTSCGGIGNTGNFASSPVKTAFTILFGSYFGDWGSDNNFLRAPLCAGALSCVWAGRPNWYFHHMALGETLGYAARLTHNNTSYSPFNYGNRWVHIGLMGDPSLRMDYFEPATSMSVVDRFGEAEINWTASPAAGVIGYNVYRANGVDSAYIKINTTPIAGTSYVDTSYLGGGQVYYMVRALRLETTKTASYYNLSLGVRSDAYLTSVEDFKNVIAHLSLSPNPSQGLVRVNLDYPDGFQQNQLELHVCDLRGALLQRQRLVEKTSTIDAQQFPSGLYLVQLVSKGKTLVQRKMIIQR